MIIKFLHDDDVIEIISYFLIIVVVLFLVFNDSKTTSVPQITSIPQTTSMPQTTPTSINNMLNLELIKEQIKCLASNVYHEARGSTPEDQTAVADVVLNRVLSKKYPDTICGVVKQARLDEDGNPKLNKCQFSWYCDTISDEPKEKTAWQRANEIAHNIIQNGVGRGITNGSTHYHATSIKPFWAKYFEHVGTIGAHDFYVDKQRGG